MADGLAKTLEHWPIDRLIPYAKNARTHSEAQVAQIAASIREFGFTIPVLVDEAGGIIAGHGRVLAARLLGMAEVPVIVARGWSDVQRRAYILADNRLALGAGWDESLLALELGDLKEFGFDPGLAGFSPGEIEALFARAAAHAGLTDPDAAPEPPAVPVSAVGDLWRLGRHRILCGDATSVVDVGRLLGDAKPHLMVTDPPYGVSYDADWRNSAQRANGQPFGGRAVGKVNNDDRVDWLEAWALFQGDVAYVWHGALHVAAMSEQLSKSGLDLRALIVWAKNNFAVSRGHYHWQHETCWYAVRAGKKAHWHGDRSQTTLWQIDKPMKSETGHSTQKPVECMRRPIENNSTAGQAVYDPFLGSGTTVIAAEMTARTCYGLEIDPGYCDVIVRRWQEFTGEKATLAGDERTLDEIAAERVGTDARPQTEADNAEGTARPHEPQQEASRRGIKAERKASRAARVA